MIVRSLKLAIAALAFSGSVSAWAVLAVPVCESGGPSVSITVDGADPIDLICLSFGEDGKSFADNDLRVVAEGSESVLATLDGTFSGNSDPFFDFGVSITNLTRTDRTFTLTWTSPYIGGTYDTMSSQFILAAQDDDRIPGVTVTPTAGSILTASLDGVPVAALAQGDGCALSASGPCDPNTLLTSAVSSNAAGTFSSTVSFTLSGLDAVNFEGRIALFNKPVGVPAPGALAVLGASLLGLGLFRRRRLV